MNNWSLKARFNRVVSDVRCAIGGSLIKLGAWITDASVHSHNGDHTWKWQSLTKRDKP